MIANTKIWFLQILLYLVFGLLLFAILSSAESENGTSETDPAVELEPVVVTATRTPQRLKDTPVITNLITRAEIEATGAENIGEVLEHTAGIVIHRDGHGDGVQLQGLDSEYVLILVDGEPQVGRIAGKLDMARLAVENVERIEIVKGATAALFGNAALGGVINIITRKATSPFSVQFSQTFEQNSTLNSRGTLELQRDKLNALLTLSRNQRSSIDLDPSDLTTTIDGYANVTGSAQIEYQLTPATSLLFSGQYFTQDQEGISETGSTVFDRLGDIENYSGSLGIAHEFGDSTPAYGTLCGFVGPNGAGKSTLLRLISGELLPTTGEIRLFGKPIRKYEPNALARLRAYLQQKRDINFPFTSLEVVLFGRHPYLNGTKETERDVSIAKGALQQVEADMFEERLYPTLSGGEASRVDVARILTQAPHLFLLDEPTNHLDPRHQIQILNLCKTICSQGKTVITAIHDLNLASMYADQLLLLKDGLSVACGPSETVLTLDMLSEVYGIPFDVLPHPDGYPWVMPTVNVL